MDLKQLTKQINEEKAFRTATIKPVTRADGEEPETFEISFSSEAPYERFFGIEVLGHEKGEADFDWIGSGNAPFLLNHDTTKQVGVIESAKIENGRGKAIIRFGCGDLAREIRQDVIDGIRKNISVGYYVNEMRLVKENKDAPNEYRVTSWAPFEASSVAVPADQTVGTNRSKSEPEGKTMSEAPKIEVKTDPAAEAALARQREQEQNALIKDACTESVNSERQRIADIEKASELHKLPNDVKVKAIAEGTSQADFRQVIIDNISTKAESVTADPAKLTKQESRDVGKWSLQKAIAGTVAAAQGGKFEGIEAEMHQEGVRQAKENGLAIKGNLVLPTQVMHQRDFTVGTEGADIVPEDFGSLIDLLRNKLVLRDLGARFLTNLSGDQRFPRLSGAGTFTWEGETDANAESTPTTDSLAMTPNRGGTFYQVSKQALIQANPDIEAMLRDDLARITAVELDRVGIEGSGAGSEPEGILNASGIGDVSLGANGAALTWAGVVNVEKEVSVDNADIGSLSYLTNSKVIASAKTIEKATNTAQFLIDRDGMMNGYNVARSNNVPSDLTDGTGTALSALIFGNFNDLLIGMWGGIDILVDPYSAAKNGMIDLVLNIYADVGLRHVESFAACQDIVAA